MKRNHLLSLVLSAALCAGMLAGCNSGTPSGSTGSSGAAGGSQAASGDTIKVGILAPLTGDAAQYGIAASNAAKLYFDQLNAAGGVNGKSIEYILLDEKGQAADAVVAYNNLLEQGVTAIVGDVTTAPTIAVAVESASANIPMSTGSATAAAVTVDPDTNAVRSNVFRSCFIDPFQGEKMASFSKEKLGAKTAAILFNSNIDYSIGLKDAFIAKAGEIGLEIVATESYADTDVDFKGQLTNINAKAPDVLFCPDYYQKVALIAPQAKEVGLTATFVGGDGWDGAIEAINDTAMIEGAYYCSGFSADDTSEAVQKFLSDYKAAYNSDPNMFAATTYDAAAILADAIKSAEDAGLTAGSDDYKAAVISAVSKTDKDYVTGHFTFDANNDPVKDAVIIKITDGKYTFDCKF